MATRMQQRRGTAAQWISTNDGDGPILNAGEIGYETDTNKFKVGDGVNHWVDLNYFLDAVALGGSIDDYIPLTDKGAVNGVAALDASKNVIVPGTSIIIEGTTEDAYETTLTITDATADRTITFPNLSGTVLLDGDLTTHNSDTTQVHGITDTAELATKTFAAELLTNATKSNITITGDKNGLTINAENGVADSNTDNLSEGGTNKYFTDERAQDAIGNAVGTGLSYNDTTGAISVDTTAIQARVADVSDTEIGYLNGVTSAIQTQIDAKLSSSTASSTYAPLENPTFTGTVTLPTGTVTAGMILDGTIVNADINASAAIAQSKIDGLTTDLSAKLALAGGTMTGAITLHADPSSALHATTKQYVDNTASGVVAKPQVLAATSTNLSVTYDNGTLGVGGTLTATSNGAWPTTVAGATGWVIGSGLLVKNQTNKAHNGRYFLSDLGSVSTPWVLTRCGYCDEADEIPGAYIFVQSGTLAGTGWIQVVADPATFVVGTDNIDVFQFSGSGTITAGTGISVSGNEVSINTATTVDLNTAQTLTNKTLTTPTLTLSSTTSTTSGRIAFDATNDKIIVGDGTNAIEFAPSTTLINAQTASYTLVAADKDKMVEMGVGSANNLTVPLNSSVPYAIGTKITVVQTGSGQTTIAPTGGVTINGTPGLKLRAQWSAVTLVKRAENTWVAFGDLTA
jgi:hypothetical protein